MDLWGQKRGTAQDTAKHPNGVEDPWNGIWRPPDSRQPRDGDGTRTQELSIGWTMMVFVEEEVPCINDGPGDFGGVHVSFWGCICSKMLCVYDTESRWRWRHWRICVRGHDKPLHRNRRIYFPGGIDNMSIYVYIHMIHDTWYMNMLSCNNCCESIQIAVNQTEWPQRNSNSAFGKQWSFRLIF